jgi:D-aminopeptidase
MPRRFFAGRYALDGGDGFTGLGVTEDFGALSTPIVLAPAVAVGKVYDGLIRYGLGLAAGLPEDAGWPPVVIGIDDSGVNDPMVAHASITQAHLDSALTSARGGEVEEGAVGVGAGLVSFGVRGGIGTASRRIELDGKRFHVGVLVAANGGEPERLSVDGVPVGSELSISPAAPGVPRSAATVVATDAPCDPGQLDRLAGRAALGLTRVGLLDALTREGLVIALSTSGLDDAGGESGITSSIEMTSEQQLPALFAAAAEGCEEAVLNALLASRPLSDVQRSEVLQASDRPGLANALRTLPTTTWPQLVRTHRQRRGRAMNGGTMNG